MLCLKYSSAHFRGATSNNQFNIIRIMYAKGIKMPSRGSCGPRQMEERRCQPLAPRPDSVVNCAD